VLNTARALDTLVKGFLDFSREQRLTLRTVQLPDFLLDICSNWQPLAAQRGITLKVVLQDELPRLRVDDEKIRRVVENLVKNALEAIGHGPGQVVLRARRPDAHHVRISVEDTGPGVPAGIDPFRLFESTKPEGTGLGLAIVNQIVQAHEGTITFADNQPRGAVFHVDLPVRVSAARSESTE
jgi:signal transduction histidine kinase